MVIKFDSILTALNTAVNNRADSIMLKQLFLKESLILILPILRVYYRNYCIHNGVILPEGGLPIIIPIPDPINM